MSSNVHLAVGSQFPFGPRQETSYSTIDSDSFSYPCDLHIKIIPFLIMKLLRNIDVIMRKSWVTYRPESNRRAMLVFISVAMWSSFRYYFINIIFIWFNSTCCWLNVRYKPCIIEKSDIFIQICVLSGIIKSLQNIRTKKERLLPKAKMTIIKKWPLFKMNVAFTPK